MSDFFRIQLGIVSRSEGHSAAKRSAYQSCGVIVAHDGERFDFSRKAAEHVQTIMLVPDAAPGWARDPQSLWQRAAAAEKRVDAQEARIVDFSMPRAIPQELWEACIRHVYEPFLRRGMTMQVDIHDAAASDGDRNVNVHGLAVLREIDGDGFASRKNRAWNDHFRERGGRVVREQFAERLTLFCQEHGIDYQGDARSNAERDRPDPEPELPKWNFEAVKRGDEMPEALAVLHQHRDRRREWERAKIEEDEAIDELQRLETRHRESKRRLMPADAGQRRSARWDRRAAILRSWHGGDKWIDTDTVAEIAAVRFDDKRDLLWIDLKDGTALIDRGDAISLRGSVTWTAAMETAAAAERHGWSGVQIYGDREYKDAVAIACLSRGIEVTNHALSPKAQAIFDRLQVERSRESNESDDTIADKRKQASDPVTPPLPERPSSEQIHHRITKRRFVKNPPLDGLPKAEEPAPAYKPRLASPSRSRMNPERSAV